MLADMLSRIALLLLALALPGCAMHQAVALAGEMVGAYQQKQNLEMMRAKREELQRAEREKMARQQAELDRLREEQNKVLANQRAHEARMEKLRTELGIRSAL